MANAIEVLIGGDWVLTGVMALLGAGIRGVLLLAVVLGVAAGLRGASAATRHAVLGAGFLVMLMLPFGRLLPWQLPLLPAGISGGSGAGAVEVGRAEMWASIETSLLEATGEPAAPPAIVSPSVDPTASKGLDPLPVRESSAVLSEAVADPGVASTASAGDRVQATLIGVWFAGLLFFAFRILVGHWMAGRLLRRARLVNSPEWMTLLWESSDRLDIDVDVRLMRSPDSAIAFATGIRRPTVVVPASADHWDLERRRAVLMHELAHVRRRDLLLHHASRWVCALYWFNPFVWVGARRLRAESERAADDLVLGVGTLPSEYANHLLQIVAGARPLAMPGPLLPLARRREFEGRILAILEPHLRRTEPSRLQAVVLTLAIGLLALPLAALTPVQEDASGRMSLSEGQQETPTATAGERSGSAPAVGTMAEGLGVLTPLALAGDLESDLTPAPLQSPPALGAEPRAPRAAEPGTSGDREHEVAVDVDFQVEHEVEYEVQQEVEHEVEFEFDADTQEFVRSVIDSAPLDVGVDIRVAIVETLADYEDPRAIAALIRLLEADPVPEVRMAAAQGLGELEAVEAIDALGEALIRDADPLVRAAAAYALGEIEDDRATEPLIVAVNDQHEAVRRAAVQALSDIESTFSAPGLVRALSDPDPAIRRQAAWTLGEIDLLEAPPELVGALADENAQVRVAAARSLGEIEDPSAAAALSSALSDVVEEVRSAALEALIDLDTEEAVDALIGALDDESPDVRRRVAEALGHL